MNLIRAAAHLAVLGRSAKTHSIRLWIVDSPQTAQACSWRIHALRPSKKNRSWWQKCFIYLNSATCLRMSPWREQLCGHFAVQDPRQILRFCNCVVLQLHFRELQAAICALHCGFSQYEHTFVCQTFSPKTKLGTVHCVTSLVKR